MGKFQGRANLFPKRFTVLMLHPIFREGLLRTSMRTRVMSAFAGKADVAISDRHVCF
jgi:hypothetical protein